jgi:hypothetical protein
MSMVEAEQAQIGGPNGADRASMLFVFCVFLSVTVVVLID